MAMKLKMIRLISEYRGYAEVTNRRPKPKRPFLYLLQMRAQSSQVSAEKRRLVVESAEQAVLNAPLPVKINHVKGDQPPFPTVLG
jgi:hypothetical protein